jgi:hypothetical protein
MTPDLNHHIPEEILDEFAMEKLPEPDCALWEEHLLICAACQDRLAEMDEFIRAAKDAAEAFRKGRGLAKPAAAASHA